MDELNLDELRLTDEQRTKMRGPPPPPKNLRGATLIDAWYPGFCGKCGGVIKSPDRIYHKRVRGVAGKTWHVACWLRLCSKDPKAYALRETE